MTARVLRTNVRKRHPLGRNVDVVSGHTPVCRVPRPQPAHRNAVPSANSGRVFQLREGKAQRWRDTLPPDRDNVAHDIMGLA